MRAHPGSTCSLTLPFPSSAYLLVIPPPFHAIVSPLLVVMGIPTTRHYCIVILFTCLQNNQPCFHCNRLCLPQIVGRTEPGASITARYYPSTPLDRVLSVSGAGDWYVLFYYLILYEFHITLFFL